MSEQVAEPAASPDENISISDPSKKDQEAHLSGDKLMIAVGNTAAWLFPILMIAIVVQVVIRKLGFNQAWLDDAQWWMYGFAMVAGFGYAITTESHVRVDIFHQRFSTGKKAKLEVFALGWLLLPFLGMLVDILSQYALSSITAREGSDSPNGLHKLYLLKTSLPILILISIAATWSTMNRNIARFTSPALWKTIIGCLPFCWFVAERLCNFLLSRYVQYSEPELSLRKVAKHPLLEHSTMAGLAIIVVVLIVAFLARRNKSES